VDLSLFNPWWKTSEVPSELLGMERHILNQVWAFIDYRQIAVLYGIRRAGKTTLMYQLISRLLTKKRVLPARILYFSFDELVTGLINLLEDYSYQILRSPEPFADKTYLFLDEIQKLDDWPNQLKIIYDRYPGLKIIISGSADLLLRKGAKESLAGRFFDFSVSPFSFEEFIESKKVNIERNNETLYKRELKLLFREYLKMGGFIEAAEFSDNALRKYFKESLLERVVFRDIPESFTINKPQVLFRLLQICAQLPGMYLEYKNLGNDLKMDERTLSNYISYLEYSFLARKLYNFSLNLLTSEKKLKRLYLANTGFLWALSYREPDDPLVIETYFANLLRSRFFYRSPQRDEVDFVLSYEDHILPIEIKIRDRIRPRDLRGIVKFMNRFRCTRGLVISRDDDSLFRQADKLITIIPYWRYWSLKKEISKFQSTIL